MMELQKHTLTYKLSAQKDKLDVTETITFADPDDSGKTNVEKTKDTYMLGDSTSSAVMGLKKALVDDFKQFIGLSDVNAETETEEKEEA